jgi:CRP-like cAMP-binding protein
MVMQLQPNLASPLRSHPLFAQMPAAWARVEGALRTRRFVAGDNVVSHGDEAAHLWIVVQGWVKLTRQTPDGKETIVGLCTERDVFGEAALFAHASYPYHADVVSAQAELALIPAEVLRAAVGSDPAFSGRLLSLLSERMAQTQLKLEHMSTLSAAQRLGCFLLRLCHDQAHGAKSLEIPVEKHILAAYLGMKPETLSRSQQQLRPLGILVKGAHIDIENIGRLREFVCGSCSESGNCDVEDSAS